MKTNLQVKTWSFIITVCCFLAVNASGQWSNVGNNITDINTIPAHYSFAMDKADTPYVAFADNFNQYLVTVKKLVNGVWVNVGTPGFVSGGALFYHPGTSIAINPVDNTPYLAICDQDTGNKVSVMRFNGSQWVYVGKPGFSSPEVYAPKLVFTSTGIPYVSFTGRFDEKISVMRFTGGSWGFAGPSNFATGRYVQMTAAPNNSISIAYNDQDNEGKISVRRLNGSAWPYVGAAGFSNGIAENTSITADANNALYVSYSDYTNAEKITVKKLVANVWTTLGSPSFSQFTATSTDVSVNRYGVPYVSYVDGGLPVSQKFINNSWTKLGNYIQTQTCQFTSILNDTLGNPYVLLALQSFTNNYLPFVKKYSPCNEADYNFAATVVLDSAIKTGGGSTTVTVTATGGVAPYFGTGTFTVTVGYYTYTITDRNGCATTVNIDVTEPCPNRWTGSASTEWEDPANWSCGTVPEANTMVYVDEGMSNYPVISSIVTCKQLTTSPGVSITIAKGGKLNITGP